MRRVVDGHRDVDGRGEQVAEECIALGIRLEDYDEPRFLREVGQLIALSAMLALVIAWRRQPGFGRQALAANVLIMAAGFLLMQQQLAGYFMQGKGLA